uniref:RNA polymerase sigma factor n=1 Tax=uncultured Muribaculum sp. TaxID=1918613 RepID=UPI00265FE553
EVRFFDREVSYWCMTRINDIEQLFKTHYVAMHRLSMQILRDEDVARDIVHDVFESLLNAGLTDVSGRYLLRAVRNRCLNHLRGLSAKERIIEVYALDEKEIADEEWPDDETIAKIHETVANDLTDACRRVIELRFSDGRSYKEIASTLGISEVAVYKHLRHAIDVLRSKLSQNG